MAGISFDKYCDDHPLVLFSVYTNTQTETILKLGKEIFLDLDKVMSVNSVFTPAFTSAHGKFWLWVLGSNEIVRTMKEAQNCFSIPLNHELRSFYKIIKELRIPFAKQELAGRDRIPVHAELSVYEPDLQNKDLIYKVKNEKYSTRKIVLQFEQLILNIKRGDIICDLREIYKQPNEGGNKT